MDPTRRRFLLHTAVGLTAATRSAARVGAWGTSPSVGPQVTEATFAEAEKLLRVQLTPAERAQAARSWGAMMAHLPERRSGPRQLAPELAPATRWDPHLLGEGASAGTGPTRERFVRSAGPTPPLPARDEDIAHAPVALLSRWVRARPHLRAPHRHLPGAHPAAGPAPAVRHHAHRGVRAAPGARGRQGVRGGELLRPPARHPLGAKDLVDTSGIPTTYGAEPFRDRVPAKDAVSVERLHKAGAVLVAKLSLGALALNDVWFGGETKNSWLPKEGSSGSSAGPGAATAAGLVGFSLGSETDGSIIAPAMRCGVVGLRSTFGRVPRTSAMTLSWTLDKLGPMTRGGEDALFVLQALSSPDTGDPSSVLCRLAFDAGTAVKGLRVGYMKAWMDEAPATDVDRAALKALRRLGLEAVPVTLPDWPYQRRSFITSMAGSMRFTTSASSRTVRTSFDCPRAGKPSRRSTRPASRNSTSASSCFSPTSWAVAI